MYPRKKCAILMLCAILLFSFAGCKNDKETPQPDKDPTSSQVSDNSSDSSSESDGPTDDNPSSDPGTISKGNTDNNSNAGGSQSGSGYHTDRYVPTASGSDSSGGSTVSSLKYTAVSWDGPAGYTIVVPKDNAQAASAAKLVQQYFGKNAGVSLSIVTDDAAAKDKEILIGKTKRHTYKAAEGEYFVKLSGKKLVIGGGHDAMVKAAAQAFARLPYKKGTANEFSVQSDFTATRLGYSYVWGDEFEGTALDTDLWCRATKMSATAEMMLDNTDRTARVENGQLKMFATRYWDAKRAGVEYAAPWSVTTIDTMSWRYGYVEMRARVPFVRGAWPSFWTSSYGSLGPKTSYDYSVEVDIFEVFSSTDTLAPNVHKWYDDGNHTMWADENEKYVFNSPDLKDEYHIYGFEWTPTEMSMYVDGIKYYTYDLTKNFDGGDSGMDGFEMQLHLILNNHLFTQSSDYKPYDGCDIYPADLPVEYDIDWLRLYQKNDGVSKLYTK